MSEIKQMRQIAEELCEEVRRATLEQVDKKLNITKVIRSGPAVIVFWEDGDKTVVKKMDTDEMDVYSAVAQAYAKRLYGSTSKFHRHIDKVLEVKDKDCQVDKVMPKPVKKGDGKFCMNCRHFVENNINNRCDECLSDKNNKPNYEPKFENALYDFVEEDTKREQMARIEEPKKLEEHYSCCCCLYEDVPMSGFPCNLCRDEESGYLRTRYEKA